MFARNSIVPKIYPVNKRVMVNYSVETFLQYTFEQVVMKMSKNFHQFAYELFY